jgi:hypothetical protein
MTDRRKIGQELVRRVTRVSEVLEDNGRLRDEIARLRLTDAEREAVTAAVRIIDAYDEEMDGFSSHAAATLRGLLERMGGGE